MNASLHMGQGEVDISPTKGGHKRIPSYIEEYPINKDK